MASKVDPELVRRVHEQLAALPAIATMATPDVVRILDSEARFAAEQDRSGAALEHLLRAIIAEPAGAEVLRNSGAQLETLELALIRSGSRARYGDTAVRAGVVQFAQFVAHRENRNVTITDLLYSLLRKKSSIPDLLAKHGARPVDVLRYLAHGLVKFDGPIVLPPARVVRGVPADPDSPGRYHVVFINDDFTAASFVLDVLMSVFGKTEAEAQLAMRLTHDQGRATVAELELNKALRRVRKATRRAEKAGFPLRITIEPVDAGL